MANPLQHPQSTATVFLDQPPSCLEFCPSYPNHFILGTYLLSETKTDGDIQQKKTGSLQLWKLDPQTDTLSLIQRISLPYAVFDLHFHPEDPTVLAIAGSEGSVALFKVESQPPSQSPDPTVNYVWTMSVHDEKDPPIPALFLAWMPKNWLPGSGDGFAVTFSDGRTSIFGTRRKEITEVNSLTELGSFDARQPIEVWFVALATYQENDRQDAPRISYMFTGNDFGSLHTRRLKTGPGLEEDDEDGISPLSLLLDYDDRARHHTSGVTSILPLPGPLFEGAPLLLTGSYDEYLRVYHASMKGRVLAEVCLGGGVWRLQLLRTEKPSEDGAGPWHWLVLASCMHGGTRVVRVTWRGDEWDMGILVEFTEHESMNYASDAWKGSQDGLVCVSSSFYDRRVCLWRADV